MIKRFPAILASVQESNRAPSFPPKKNPFVDSFEKVFFQDLLFVNLDTTFVVTRTVQIPNQIAKKPVKSNFNFRLQNLDPTSPPSPAMTASLGSIASSIVTVYPHTSTHLNHFLKAGLTADEVDAVITEFFGLVDKQDEKALSYMDGSTPVNTFGASFFEKALQLKKKETDVSKASRPVTMTPKAKAVVTPKASAAVSDSIDVDGNESDVYEVEKVVNERQVFGKKQYYGESLFCSSPSSCMNTNTP